MVSRRVAFLSLTLFLALFTLSQIRPSRLAPLSLIFNPQSLITNLLSTPTTPSLPSLLSMIRLNDAVMDELTDRATTPLESFVLKQKLTLWPLFQKGMSANVESLKRLADAAGAGGGMLGGLGLGGKVKDGAVELVSPNSLFRSGEAVGA